jgi:hypothetical protein
MLGWADFWAVCLHPLKLLERIVYSGTDAEFLYTSRMALLVLKKKPLYLVRL